MTASGQTLPNVDGQSVSALPSVSDVNLFRHRENVALTYSGVPRASPLNAARP